MNCPCCGATSAARKWEKAGYVFLRCADCELIFLDPLPTAAEIDALYEKDFFASQAIGYRNYEREQRWREKNYARDLAVIEGLVQGGRLLDVGCATGTFLKVCPDRWEKHGQEVSRYAGEEARKHFGDRIEIGALQQTSFAADHFDVVTLWETVNHMLDPFGDLRHIGRLLKPAGILALSVGDVGSLLARLMGKYWYHVTPPLHIYYFTPRTFEIFFGSIGLDVVKCTHLGKLVDVATMFERVKDASSSRALTAVCRFLGRLPGNHLTFHVNLHDTMYLFARKRADVRPPSSRGG